MPFDSLLPQAAEKGLGNRIVPKVSPAAHAGHQLVVFAPTVEIVTAKLAVLVRMNHHRVLGVPAPHGHHQRVQHLLKSLTSLRLSTEAAEELTNALRKLLS